MALMFNFESKVMPKVLINIGALFDVPTAALITGKRGETIYNGGLGPVTGIVGRGNTYKSTILHYMMLSAASKLLYSGPTAMSTYDTEVNISLDRLEGLASGFESIPPSPITGSKPIWSVVNKTMVPANKWAVELNKYATEKAKEKNIKIECMQDPYTKKELEILPPTFVEIDSLTEFETESNVEMLSKDLDGTDTNTYAMKQGLFKTKFLSQIPGMAARSNIYMLLTAHVGSKIDMSGPYAPKPARDLQFLKQDDNIKGVSSKFFFLTEHVWMSHTPTVLKNASTKGPEYPLSANDSTEPDLNLVNLTMLRSKSGPSGITVPLIISQTEGVLPSLSEFHYIKENNRFGIEGNNTSYNLIIYPDVKLSRTTVRSKIKSDKLLRRALNITAELLQLQIYHPELESLGLLCSPSELYEDIIKLGYDWKALLDTRGYWLANQYSSKELPYLSTVDLLKMRKGLYSPYWYKQQDKKEGK